ncbi:AsnC family transcriptional regulator [Selenomonadales bacterium OttesenSCG-928-I06]|nr:AsnC family transcriptional regulator [Selenomonadales bacterium OttesenSCG-928-I06]
MLDNIDKKIISFLNESFPVESRPYKKIADELNITEEEVLSRVKGYKDTGKLRKMGAVLRHRNVGFKTNVLCVWKVSEDKFKEVADIMLTESAITHCYSRVSYPEWPYNFYTMIHAADKTECENIVKRLSEKTKLEDYKMLYSIFEWKKESMKYFT